VDTNRLYDFLGSYCSFKVFLQRYRHICGPLLSMLAGLWYAVTVVRNGITGTALAYLENVASKWKRRMKNIFVRNAKVCALSIQPQTSKYISDTNLSEYTIPQHVLFYMKKYQAFLSMMCLNHFSISKLMCSMPNFWRKCLFIFLIKLNVVTSKNKVFNFASEKVG